MSIFRPIANLTSSPHTGRKLHWAMALVFIPLLLLAALGVRGLQMSRHAAREAAVREIDLLVRSAAQSVDRNLTNLRNAPIPRSYPVPPQASPSNKAQELYDQALRAAPSETAPILEEIATQYPDEFSGSGIPLLPLVEWRRVQHSAKSPELLQRVEALARAAVETHPSIITPELLDRAESLLREHGGNTTSLATWRERWKEDERARTVLRANATVLSNTRAPGWLRSSDEIWWAEFAETNAGWRLLSKERLLAMTAAVLNDVRESIPDYAGLNISLSSVPLLEGHTGERLAQLDQGSFVLTGILRDPAKLYAQQNQQTLWLTALLGCAVLAACGGVWMMSTALTRERRLSELKSDFVSSVSHELRAPVASMRIMAENLSSGIVSDETRRREYHQLIADECWRLSTLIENVLDLARIERNRKTYRFCESDAVELFRDAVQLLQPRAAQRRQTIRIDFPESFEPPPICDSLAVQQALINLLDNAIKFSPEGTVVLAQLGQRGADKWEISVTDQGPGVPETEQANIFERFYRIGSELQRETQGTGIGLSIVKHIAAGHGGSVSVENQPKGGAKFAILLPRIPPGVSSDC